MYITLLFHTNDFIISIGSSLLSNGYMYSFLLAAITYKTSKLFRANNFYNL